MDSAWPRCYPPGLDGRAADDDCMSNSLSRVSDKTREGMVIVAQEQKEDGVG